jgi:hypothetical protein
MAMFCSEANFLLFYFTSFITRSKFSWWIISSGLIFGMTSHVLANTSTFSRRKLTRLSQNFGFSCEKIFLTLLFPHRDIFELSWVTLFFAAHITDQ